MTKQTAPATSGVLSTKDVRQRTKIVIERIVASGNELIERQRSYPEPNQEKIAFHVGRIAAAQTFERLLSATPESWDELMEKELGEITD